MRKHLFLTSLVALVATVGVASAETDVNFAGKYTDATGATVSVNTAGYRYYKSNGDERVVSSLTTNPTLADFTYTDREGVDANLSTGLKTASDFDGTSAATGDVTTTQVIQAGATMDRANYSYVNGAGDTVTLGDVAQTFTQTIDLSSPYTNGASIDVTDGVAGTFTPGMYTWTDPDTGAVYHLNATGDNWVDAYNNVQTPDVGSAQEAARDAMVAAYAADLALVNAAKTQTQTYANDEAINFAAANAIFGTDSTTVATLTARYGTYETAANLLATAQANQAAATTSNMDAQTVYNAPILTTIDGRVGTAANAAIDTSVASGSIKTALDTKADATDLTAEATARQTADTTLQGNIDAEATARQTADTTLQGNIDAEATARQTADATLQGNIDNEVARAMAQEAAIRGDFAAADAQMLANANAYTDSKVDSLEKNVSGGVAAATALSAVEVTNVKKGEMSVGGGYGYYNSQSAMALGAALGLSDNWSVNAGAGIASGDKTQVSFRAGTNYKFKLF